MRLINPRQVKWIDDAGPGLGFAGEDGERFRVTALDHDLVRVQHWPDGVARMARTWTIAGADGDTPREGRRRDDLSPFPLPACLMDVNPSHIDLRTDALQVRVHLDDFHIAWSDGAGREFAADLPRRAYEYDADGTGVWHYLLRREGEHYYGFGERAGPLDKRGLRLRMVPADPMGYDARSSDPLYKHWPFYITYVPELDIAYALLYDNLADVTFDLGKEIHNYYPPYRYYQAAHGDIDYYLIYGPSVAGVVAKLTRLIGRILLPPRWSLGYLGTTMQYTDAPDAQEQLKRFVDLCTEHSIPCDAFQLGSGYSSGADGKRYVFEWNRSKIPDPQGMVDHFHAAGMHVTANIKPALLTTHPRFDEVDGFGGFIPASQGDGPALGEFWGGQGAHLDFTNPATYAWWQDRVRESLLTLGVDATWNDNNEYPVWDDDAACHGFGHPIPLALIRPLHALLMTRASYEAQRAACPDQRPYVLCRAGCIGVQRYTATWTGDNRTAWETLRYNIPMGLGMGLSGFANTGHDVGGFAGPRPDPELFVRWVQNGIFHPRFTIHSWNADGSVTEPWMYPQMTPLVRAAIEFRYRLIPYLYTLLAEAAENGAPLVRPLLYHFARDPRTHEESFDFMLGPNLLVASVLEASARTRTVYLPAGADWCDFHTGDWYAGGQEVTVEAPLARIPLLVPAGGMIPMGRAMGHVGEQPDDLRQVYVFPHRQSGRGAFTLIEDDGESLAYRRGERTRVTLACNASPEAIKLAAVSVEGGYELPYDEIEFILPPGETRAIRAADERRRWRDGDGRVHVAVAFRGIIFTRNQSVAPTGVFRKRGTWC